MSIAVAMPSSALCSLAIRGIFDAFLCNFMQCEFQGISVQTILCRRRLVIGPFLTR